MSAPTTRRRPWLPAVVLIVLVLGLVAVRWIPRDTAYTAELPHAGGLRAGDTVRVAGLEIGTVSSVRAEGDTVVVDFSTDPDVALTTDTTIQVKLVSLLGKRYLELDPGEDDRLPEGGTLAKDLAIDSYTIEQFFLDATPKIEELDLDVMQQAITTLSTDLAVAPEDLRGALQGMTEVSRMVSDRDDQLRALLSSTRAVTGTVLDQQDQLDALMRDAGLVMRMVVERREAIAMLLRDARSLVTEITTLVRENTDELEPALRQARTVLRTLNEHEDDLDEILRLSGPTMRYYTNATGDGPWLGVNAPYFVFSDDFWCVLDLFQGCS